MANLRRRYNLDNQNLCFLSFFLTEDGKPESISFDVETADDYHYQIAADQLPKLCEYLRCANREAEIVEACAKQLESWKNPIEIADLCRKSGIEYQAHYWY